MDVQSKLNFEALENNIIDVIKEEQIKLGYREETLRLYYPMESINNLLGADLTIEKLSEVLYEFCIYLKERFGGVEYYRNNTRYCFVIPPKGVTFVHEEVKDPIFLQEFIETISNHNCSIEDILLVFHRYSDNVICDKVDNGEFDYLIYFENGVPDAYRYCIKFEECHVIYHRYTYIDYINFGF